MSDSGKGLSTKGADFFLVKFWTQMLENPDCRHVCEWAPDGRHLVIYDPDALMAEIKARGVCKQKDYDSFARQLRIYRWGRVKADECGISPLPPTVKVWRHPRLNRSSPLVEVANVTRNAPPKPNKAAIAAGLPEKNDSKPRNKASEIYQGSRSGSQNEDEDMSEQQAFEPSMSTATSQQAFPTTVPPSTSRGGDIPVHHNGQQQLPPVPKLPPLMPPQIGVGMERPMQKGASTFNRQPYQTMTSTSKSNKSNAKKKQPLPVVAPTKPAFDVETSIFDPNNNFAVTSASVFGLHRSLAGSRANQGTNDDSSDSSMSSDDEFDNLFLNTAANGGSAGNASSLANRAILNSAMLKISYMSALTAPQVSEAFLSKVDYGNEAIEHAAQNPANYDRLPWSGPANMAADIVNGQNENLTHDDTLASLESRLQSISASLSVTDAAVAQHAS